MNIRIYWKNRDIDSIDTTVLSSGATTSGTTWREGPGACAIWRDSLIVHDWEVGGLVLRRSFFAWDEEEERAMVRDGSTGEKSQFCDYILLTADELKNEVAEVWVDGLALFALDGAGGIGLADEQGGEE